MKYKTTDQKRRRNMLPIIFILPALLSMILIHFIPSVVGIIMSSLDFNAEALRDWSRAKFIGLGNFVDIFSRSGVSTQKFLESAKASLIYTVVCLLGIYLLGMTAALLLNGEQKWLRPLRGIFLLGWVIPSVVSTFVWKSIFSYDYGPLNYLLLKLRIIKEPVYWLVGSNALIPPIVANIWKAWPFAFITLLAGLQSIPKELYDAARVDGANKIQSFFAVTLPSLFPVSRILLLLLIIWTALDFNTVYVMYSFAPPASANVLPVYIYSTSFQTWSFGRGSAMSVIMMLFMLVFCIFYVRFVVENKKNNE